MSTLIIPSAGAYSNPALDAFIETKHDESLRTAALIGVTTAVKTPLHPETQLSVLVEPVLAAYNVLTAKAFEINGGYSVIQKAKTTIEKLEAENEALLLEADKVAGDLAIEEQNIGNVIIPSKPTRRLALAFTIAFIILSVDAYFLGTAFQKTGSSFIISLLLGLGCSLAIAVVSTLGTKFTERLKSKKAKLLATGAMGILVGLAVYILCAMRSDFYKSNTGGDISAWSLAVLSILAFAAFHLIFLHLIKPSYEQIRLRKEAIQRLAKTRELKARLVYLNQKFQANRNEIEVIKNKTLSLLHYARGCEKTIIAYYKLSVSEFKKCFTAQAGYIPQCFSQAPPALTTYYDEIPLNPNQYNEKVD